MIGLIFELSLLCSFSTGVELDLFLSSKASICEIEANGWNHFGQLTSHDTTIRKAHNVCSTGLDPLPFCLKGPSCRGDNPIFVSWMRIFAVGCQLGFTWLFILPRHVLTRVWILQCMHENKKNPFLTLHFVCHSSFACTSLFDLNCCHILLQYSPIKTKYSIHM